MDWRRFSTPSMVRWPVRGGVMDSRIGAPFFRDPVIHLNGFIVVLLSLGRLVAGVGPAAIR